MAYPFDLIKEGLFALRQELLDGQFMFRVASVENLKFGDKVRSNTTVRIRELEQGISRR